jgi:hypothetical protein
MVRGLMVGLALAAAAAHAQERKGAEHADAAPAASEKPPIVLASRSTPEPRSPQLGRSPSLRDGGVDAGTLTRESALAMAVDCSIVETFRGGGAPEVRTYQAPPREPRARQENAWDRAPYVAAVARCGRLYFFQILSQSRDAWVIDRARVEGPKGEALLANALPFNKLKEGFGVNVIAVEAPAGVKFSKLKFHLTGQDGRVAQPEARELP